MTSLQPLRPHWSITGQAPGQKKPEAKAKAKDDKKGGGFFSRLFGGGKKK